LPRETQLAHADLLHRVLSELKTDLPVAEFLNTHFTDTQFAELRDAVHRMIEGYDAADPNRASTFAFRDEWMARGPRRDGRIAGGYGALIEFLVSGCRRQGATIRLLSVVTAIEESRGGIAAYCEAWTQHPSESPVLTGWLAGPRADAVAGLTESELVNMSLDSLAEIFSLPPNSITRDLVTSHAINWGTDPFARGAYSYATPKTREAQSALRKSDVGAVLFCGEALHAGRDMGTVEAALANGIETAQAILTAG
jgi:Flavin containing amine oxidoreductase